MKVGLPSPERMMPVLIVTMLLLSALVLTQSKPGNAELTQAIREMRINKTRAAVALSVLQESEQLDAVQADTSDSIENLKLALIEALSSEVVIKLLNIHSSSIRKTDRVSLHNDNSEKSLHSLSVAISADAHEADVVLTLLQQLEAAAHWRPVELRSCSFKKRVNMSVVALSCLFDIYYFPTYDQGVIE